MKIVKIILIILIGISVFLFIMYRAAKLIAPDHYPNAEEYKLNISDSELIKKIAKFKTDNPQYIPPTSMQLTDGWDSKIHFYYYIYFYYSQENQIVFAYVKNDNKPQSTFALVSINDGLILGHWKDINKDFDKTENNEQKKKFEERILNKIILPKGLYKL